jgi:hypothetical protein
VVNLWNKYAVSLEREREKTLMQLNEFLEEVGCPG